MSVKMRNLMRFSSALAVALLIAVSLSTCDSMLGFGDAIDFEPPKLNFDDPQPPNPLHVRQGAELSGTVTDNIDVDRVIARHATTGESLELFQVTLSGDDPKKKTWNMVMNFTDDDNGKKLPIVIVAYDKAGNSGEESMAAITLSVDTSPPIVEDMWIQRADGKPEAYLEPYTTLKALETTDPLGKEIANLNKYQNGFFTIMGKVAENETAIEIISLNIYDADRDQNNPLLELSRVVEGAADTNFSPKSPRWLLSEEELLNEGDKRWPGYKNTYYNSQNDNSGRYYYRVEIVAWDNSQNESFDEANLIKQTEGYFVMWETADVPKAIVDMRSAAGVLIENDISIQKGASLPVYFFDDDQLLWGYTALLTKEQWDAEKPVYAASVTASAATPPEYTYNSPVYIAGANPTEKLQWLRDRFRSDPPLPVYNWRYDRYPGDAEPQPVIEQIRGRSLDEHIAYVQTGNNELDNGEYVLFSLAADKKLKPHTETGPYDTNRTREKLRLYNVNVIDENEPLIVFDTTATGTDGHLGGEAEEPIIGARTGDSPEENTFPRLDGGERFTINGYTLRANKPGQNNRVEAFRIAWIPADLGDTYIKPVQDALKADNYLTPGAAGSMSALEALGVKHWNFTLNDPVEPHPPATTYDGTLFTGTSQTLAGTVDGSFFKKQVFRHEFNILTDFINQHGERENTTKLFVFYAEDDMGHVVFRQLRLLGNRVPPDLSIYDLTGRINDTLAGIPNVSADPYFGNAEEPRYIDALKTFNERGDVYTLLKNSAASPALTADDKTIPFQIYTRDTILKYWVTANRSGDLNIESITMQDITNHEPADARQVGSVYNGEAMTYVESFPDETQRVFLFTATDTLGNVARAQRTIAISNMARLESITTTRGSGTYGIGNEIILQANFSRQISIVGKPALNVRYTLNGTTQIVSIPCEDLPAGTSSTLSLTFKFTVPEFASGQLITMYDGDNLGGSLANETDRPIKLGTGIRIIDVIDNRDAFVPGYKTGTASMPNWTTNKGSLQASKTITLDGARPVITTVSVSGKTAYATNQFYFKTDETIQLTLGTNAATGKNIRASTTTPPVLQYSINPLGGGTVQGPYTAYFTYLRPSGSKALVFGLEVNTDNCPIDGELVNVSLLNANTIEDEVGNGVTSTSVSTLLSLAPSGTRIYIKKSTPAAPASTLTNTAFASAATLWNSSPALRIPDSVEANTTIRTWEDTKQYSLDGGLNWVTFPTARTGWTTQAGTSPNQYLNISNGTWDVRTRYVDRAGNEGAQTSKSIEVNMAFPKLLAITSVKPNGTYKRDNSLSFNLDFADTVSIGNAANISLTLRDVTNNTTNINTIALSGTANVSVATNGKTVTFNWANVNDRDMLNGLRVSAINLSGLNDRFGNAGPSVAATSTTANSVTMPASGGEAAYSVTYSLSGVIVSGIIPVANSYSPTNAATITGNDKRPSVSTDNKTITITFSKPMQRGNGTITIRPHGYYAIPAVFENEGYYLTVTFPTNTTQTETRSSKAETNSTYVSGMNDIYNNMTPAQRNYLITSGTLADPALSPNTGLSVGPYKKMTHGLKQGAGYTGNYNNTNPTAPNAPGTTGGTTYMVPDTATKWVLDYQYQIHSTTQTQVTNIRNALTSIGFRRQQIAVTSTANVGINGSTVTITLNEPLLPGLQWDLFYDAGTFTDLAGNPAAAVADTTHWFWSRGVQAPVIRVDRKSYDGRAAATVTGGVSSFIHDGSNTTQTYAANGYAGSITDFNTVAYRIETETPGGRIYSATRLGTFYTTNIGQGNNTVTVPMGSIIGAWTGRATLANVNTTNFASANNLNWDGSKNNNSTIGTWVRPNLVFRNFNGDSTANPPTGTYTVNENGITVTQVVQGATSTTFGNNYYGFRSFNRDALFSELNGLTLATSNADNMFAGTFTYDNSGLQASKNYVAAEARIDHANANFTTATYTSPKGYEGVFRTVIALNQAAAAGGTANYILLCATNVKSGIPTVAGFPAKDGVTNTDTRYLKVFYINGTNQYYWVSTEMVTSWYMQSFRRGEAGGSYLRVGDATDWMTAGYGDLSYAYNVYSW